MTDAPQSHLVVLVAGAVLAAALLSVAAGQRAEADRARAQAAADQLASTIAAAACSAGNPEAEVSLGAWQLALDGLATAAVLYPDHVRITLRGGESVSSVTFPPLRMEAPIDLLASPGVGLTYDPFAGSCTAWPPSPENA